MTDRDIMKLALEALENLQGLCTDAEDGLVEAVTIWTPEIIDALRERLAQPEQEQEPVAWVYPEGLEALKAGKPWTAYGTRQEPNNTALYLSPQPDIAPYAWVTFTPYGDEDDVWYENPKGQLLEGWTYKPLYDTSPPQRKPLTNDLYNELLFAVETKCPDETRHQTALRYIRQAEMPSARPAQAAHGIKENRND